MKTWDVFISHASKDKGEIATPLYNKLKELGLKVWYDEEEIQPSNEIIDKISYGLEHTTYFIIILSPNFIKEGKVWTYAENQVIQYLKIQNKKKIIPIYHNLVQNDLNYKFLFIKPLASIYTKKESIDSYVVKIAKIIFEANLENILISELGSHELIKIALKYISPLNTVRDEINRVNDVSHILKILYKLDINFIPILNEIISRKDINHTNIENYKKILIKSYNSSIDSNKKINIKQSNGLLMKQQNDITLEKKQNEIEKYIISNELSIATKLIVEFVSDFSNNKNFRREALLYQRNISSLQEEIRKYEKSSELDISLKRLTNSLFEFMDVVVDEYKERGMS